MIYVLQFQQHPYTQVVNIFESRSKKGAKKFRKKCGATLNREFGREVKDSIMPKLHIIQRLEEGDPGYVPVIPVTNRIREAAARIRLTGEAMTGRIDGIGILDEVAPIREGTWAGIMRTAEPQFRATPPTTGGQPLFGGGWVTRNFTTDITATTTTATTGGARTASYYNYD